MDKDILRETLDWWQAGADFFNQYKFLFESVSFMLSAIFAFGIVYILVKSSWLNGKVERFIDVTGVKDLGKHKSVKGWLQIKKLFQKGGVENFKKAIIGADKMFDEILKMSGYKGMSMEERLSQVDSSKISNIDKLRRAHKVRNHLEHEPDVVINQMEARIVLRIYYEAFKELRLLD